MGTPKEQAWSIVAWIINLTPGGAAHIVAKPLQFHNRTKISEGPGDGAAETGGEGEVTGTGGKREEGKDSATDGIPPSPIEQPYNEGMAIRPERERK